jgi:Cu2+-exporting ATPase
VQLYFQYFRTIFSEFNSARIDAKSSRSSVVFRSSCRDFNFGDFRTNVEAKAHQKTGNAIKELMNLSPKEAHLIQNNSEKTFHFGSENW